MKSIGEVTGSGDLTKPDEMHGKPVVIIAGSITDTKYGPAARVLFYFEGDTTKEARTTLLSSEAVQEQIHTLVQTSGFPVRAMLDQRYSAGRNANYNIFVDPDNAAPADVIPATTPGGAADDDIPF